MPDDVNAMMAELVGHVDAPVVLDACPDGGACGHGCAPRDGKCWRVRWCGPLSRVFPGDVWPEEIKAAARG